MYSQISVGWLYSLCYVLFTGLQWCWESLGRQETEHRKCPYSYQRPGYKEVGYFLSFFRKHNYTLIARFMGPTWGPSWANRTQVGPMLAPWTLLSGYFCYENHFLELKHCRFLKVPPLEDKNIYTTQVRHHGPLDGFHCVFSFKLISTNVCMYLFSGEFQTMSSRKEKSHSFAIHELQMVHLLLR